MHIPRNERRRDWTMTVAENLGARRAVATRLILAVVAILIISSASLAAPYSTQAQAAISLVSNLEQTASQTGSASVGQVVISGNVRTLVYAQRFKTGDNEDGYGLSGVTADLTGVGANALPKVSIYSRSGLNPDTLLYTLTNPPSIVNGHNTFTVPSGITLSLAKETPYFVVFENLATGSTASDQYKVVIGNWHGEDAGAATGWSIQNDGRFSNDGTWNGSGSSVQKIAIRGTITGFNVTDDATLSALTLKDGSDNAVPLSPAFSDTVGTYTGEVAEAEDSVTLTATKNDDGATVTIAGDTDTATPGEATFVLAIGGNKFTVVVTAEDGFTTRTYTVTVTRISTSDATLQSLQVGYLSADKLATINVPLDPEFSPQTTSYTAGVPGGITEVYVDATANETDNALLTTLPDGSTQHDEGLAEEVFGDVSPGLNTFTVKVTAPDGMTTKTYTITVDRGGGLKVRLENLPSSHDGSTAFTVTLKFNKDISDDSIANLDGAVVITNGTKSDLAAVGGSKRNFTMTITPSSGDPVRILVRKTEECSFPSHPICTDAGEVLGEAHSRWVGTVEEARLRALWLTTKDGDWVTKTPSFSPDTYRYNARVDLSEMKIETAPYTRGVTIAVTGPAGTFTASNRWDGGKTVKLDLPTGVTTWSVTVTSQDGTKTRTYVVTVNRASVEDVRLKTLTVTPVNGTALSFTPSFHLGTEARTFRVRVSSGTTAVTVSVEKNSSAPEVRLMRTETDRLDAIDQDPDLAGVQFDLEMDRFDLELGRQNRYRSIWVIGPNARVEGHTAFNRRVYQLWITKSQGTSMATEAEPLMAAFENAPLSHDGSSAFTLRMAFSEDVEITPEDMRDHALTVLGGTVTAAEQVEGLKTLWDLTIQPSGNGSVFILTPLNRACTEVGALCTADGGTLTVAPALQIAGPPPPQVNNPATGAPSIGGTPQVGETLTADTSGIADADGLSNVTYSYQWLRNDGTSDTDITGTTASTYTLVDADEGKTIKVKVSFTDDADNGETLTSAATVSVDTRPIQGSAPDTPDQPVGTAVFVGGVDLEWNDVPGADSYDVQLFRNGQWMDLPGDGVEIAFYGAGAIISELDPGSTHWFQVRARNAHGSSDWSDFRQVGSTNQSALGKRARPDNVTASGAPVINGTAQVGESLTADAAGIEDGNGLDRVQFRFQWVTNDGSADAEITGATDSSYTLLGADEGRTVKVRVSFTDRGGYAESLTSAATDTVSFAVQQQVANSPATGAPAITGTAQVGETLTADISGIADADGLTNVSYSYQWVANDGTADMDITGSTGSTYTLVDADEGSTIRVRVSFTDDAGNEETLTGAATATVDAALNNPASGAPSITGTAQVGETLTADISGIADADGLDSVSYSYQWLADDAAIQGATDSSYTLVDEDEGSTIRVRVSFTDDAGNEETLTSAATTAVDAAPNNPASGAPTITGTAQVGETLTADISSIADADGLSGATFSYQWVAGGSDIAGATGSSHTLAFSEQGQTMQVRVSFNDDRSNAESLTSAAMDAVAPPPLTVSLEDNPASHDGQNVFTFEIRFSEEFALSFRVLKLHAFTVTGGSVKKAQRMNEPSNIPWRITVQPDSNGDVTIVLPTTTDCDDQGAICTGDGRMLSNSLDFTVSGPGG